MDLVLALNMNELVSFVYNFILENFLNDVFKSDNSFELIKFLSRRRLCRNPGTNHGQVPNTI